MLSNVLGRRGEVLVGCFSLCGVRLRQAVGGMKIHQGTLTQEAFSNPEGTPRHHHRAILPIPGQLGFVA